MNKHANQKFSSFPAFTSRNNYEAYIINQSSHTDLLHYIIARAQNTNYFSIDTEADLYTQRPALIQFEFIHQELSTVILLDVCHLPTVETSLKFWLIRAIIKYIFQKNKILYCWGPPLLELRKFLHIHLFTDDDLNKPEMFNSQDDFKQWHCRKFHHNVKGGNLWGLQAAIHDQFGQFLDKTERLNIWSRDLTKSTSKSISMIQYAVNDCLAVTKLVSIM
ncbi:unnamed protein product [Rotaria magnacalcarata]|uniref:3'-5' exonuclease domain-containing protein n=1 Tax=Rotaria magnacalcarata TaxID=392030 RepID=A0A820AWT4_9BILA|nr:unnamed protein product [Rotaria magnacalcarata]CAF4183823.1 unnamed protein product [Rotaria magnacalcarata]